MATEMTEQITEVTAALADQRDAITVARVDAPRRRDDVLPEHEERWPVTELARELIQARYDGTAGTSHEIGLELVTPKHGAYPSWRIEQIARDLGLAGEKRDAIIERVRREDAAGKAVRQRTPQPTAPRIASIDDAIAAVSGGVPTATRTMLREDLQAIADGPVCAQCGRPYQPWRRFRGELVAGQMCHACFSAKVAERTAAKVAGKAEHVAKPEVPPEPVYVAGPNFPAMPAVLEVDLPLDAGDEDDCDLTFADLPGHGAVFELLDLLPTNGRWSGRRRYRWLTAFTATLDLLIDDDRDDETRETVEEVAR